MVLEDGWSHTFHEDYLDSLREREREIYALDESGPYFFDTFGVYIRERERGKKKKNPNLLYYIP
jgi:hypothetical protein